MCGFLCIFRAFLVCALCSSVFSFCNPCRPSHFSVPIRSVAPVRLPCFPCVRLLSSSIHLSLPPCLLLFYGLCPSLLSFLCVRLLTHALYFPCVPFVPVLLPLVVLSALLSPSLGFPFPLCVFSVSLPPPSRCIPPFPRRLSLLFLLRSRVFLPLFSALFLSFVFH